MPKDEIDTINAVPSKRIYLSIISDYDLNTAISELIDNAIDAAWRKKGGPSLKVAVEIDTDQQKITIRDNAGGVKKEGLTALIAPGETSDRSSVIGIFGVGSKRSVVALAQHIRITTRSRGTSSTYRLEYDDEWLASDDWHLPYHRMWEGIRAGSTIIELSNLRSKYDDDNIVKLREHLGATYGLILNDRGREVEILVNEKRIERRLFDNWAFPRDLVPHRWLRRIAPKKGRKKIRFVLTAGLVREKGSEYGVYIYCNNRLICRSLRSPEVGFSVGRAGVAHHVELSISRVIIELDGPPEEMPWTSNKASVNYSHRLFRAIRDDIVRAVTHYSKISRRLFKNFEHEVLPFDRGDIVEHRLQSDDVIGPSRLPNVPKGRRYYKDQIIELNEDLGRTKPWVRGLYEAIIAEEAISKMRLLKQRNRLSMIILDSTLEIAFKEYLVYEADQPISNERLKKTFIRRHEVHHAIRESKVLEDSVWGRIDYYYQLRCDLVHQKASADISNDEIREFRSIVALFLKNAFGIQFPGAILGVGVE